jgi:SWI/SNF-related matrix-associated actin-dependent regulator of chromatin subfamily A member 5
MLLDRLLLRLRKNNCRFLIFSQFTETLDILEEYITYRFGPINEVYFRLDGSTNRIMRELNVRTFNSPDTKSFIYLISTTAGGVGINLATADSVILYDSSWNPQVDLQVNNLIYHIYYIIYY